MTPTFLELGDATSRNLEFSHCGDVWVSYGEETITETNLMETRRRHPERVRVRSFPKPLYVYSGANRSPISAQTDHSFRSNPISDSGAKPITFGVGTGMVRGV